MYLFTIFPDYNTMRIVNNLDVAKKIERADHFFDFRGGCPRWGVELASFSFLGG